MAQAIWSEFRWNRGLEFSVGGGIWVMASKRMGRALGILLVGVLGAIASGCGSGGEGLVLVADAEFDPVTASDHNIGISELMPGVAQTFTVLADGRLERFWLVVTDGESPDDGTIRVTVRPLVGGLPDPNPASSIIRPIDVDTTILPATLVEQFTIFDVGDHPGRDVLAGEQYALVIEFLSRTGVDTTPIARVLGQTGDPFPGGTGAADAGGGFVANTNDYLFRTFVLQPN